jgi:hypothetical protein
VLIVIVVLSLVAYRFTDAMTSEYRAGIRGADMVQARAAAASGIHYAAAMLSDPTTRREILGDPFDNPSAFQDIPVRIDPNNPNRQLRFSIISVAMVGPGVYEQRYGVIDEGGKLNPNALIVLDRTGQVLYNALLKLPNMTEAIADAIVDWVDADDNVRASGAESSHYEGLANPYRAKNGPLNSIDELLLVKDVTPQLLFGTDRNRNGLDDDLGGTTDRGWADYLTVHSRELNVNSSGVLRVWINGDDVNAIYKAMNDQGLDGAMAAYIIAAKLYGTTRLDAQGNPISGGGGGGGKGKGKGGKKDTKQQKVRVGGADELITAVEKSLETASSSGGRIASIMDLISTRVTLPRTGESGPFGTGDQQETVVVNCPLNESSRLNELLPSILDLVTTTEPVEMVPRVNAVTAPREVLLGLPGLTETDVDGIINARDGLYSDDPTATSAAWLVTSAGLTTAKFKALERYVTGTTMVYRVEAVGYLAAGGPVARVEAVIDTNQGSPRILYYRELTDLDSPRAFQPQQPQR